MLQRRIRCDLIEQNYSWGPLEFCPPSTADHNQIGGICKNKSDVSTAAKRFILIINKDPDSLRKISRIKGLFLFYKTLFHPISSRPSFIRFTYNTFIFVYITIYIYIYFLYMYISIYSCTPHSGNYVVYWCVQFALLFTHFQILKISVGIDIWKWTIERDNKKQAKLGLSLNSAQNGITRLGQLKYYHID